MDELSGKKEEADLDLWSRSSYQERASVKPDVIACLVGKYYSNCISLTGCTF